MARSQMEIMGLVIVVILLTVGLLLVVQFVVLKPTSNLKTRQEFSELAANMMSTMLESSTTCNGYSLRSLIQNCATKNDIFCPNPNFGRPDQPACNFTYGAIDIMLNRTLKNWSMSYNVSVSGTATNYPPRGISFLRGDCTGAKEAKFSPIQAGARTLTLDVQICYGS